MRQTIINRRTALAVLGSLALEGCRTHQTLRLDIAVDTSGSTVAARSEQPALIQASRQMLSELEVLGPQVGLWRFDVQPALLYEQTMRSAGVVRKFAETDFMAMAGAEGTYPDRLLNQVADAWATDPADRLALVLVTDGESTDATAMPEAVARIASEQRLVLVWLVGVRSEWRMEVKRVYGPLGQRLEDTGCEPSELAAAREACCQRLFEGVL